MNAKMQRQKPSFSAFPKCWVPGLELEQLGLEPVPRGDTSFVGGIFTHYAKIAALRIYSILIKNEMCSV